jgi:hypothetical protein
LDAKDGVLVMDPEVVMVWLPAMVVVVVVATLAASDTAGAISVAPARP